MEIVFASLTDMTTINISQTGSSIRTRRIATAAMPH